MDNLQFIVCYIILSLCLRDLLCYVRLDNINMNLFGFKLKHQYTITYAHNQEKQYTDDAEILVTNEISFNSKVNQVLIRSP